MKKRHLERIRVVVEKYFQERKIVVWGMGRNAEQIKEMIEGFGKEMDFGVDKDIKKINKRTIFDVCSLEGKSNEFYVCVSISEYHEEIERELQEMGYRKNRDYCYLPEIIRDATNYEDYYGNRIIGTFKGAAILFGGENACIELGENVSACNLSMLVESNCNIRLGNNVAINKLGYENQTRWFFRENSQFEIADGSVFWGYGFLHCVKGSFLKIGSTVTVQFNYLMIICENTEAIIGNNCMISYDFALFTNDAHPIWDLNTKELLNNAYEKKYRVELEPHVWIGFRVTVLKNSYIGCGTIVGSNSVINKKYPNNCCIAGNPAKIIRKNIAWNQKGNFEDVRMDYLHFSEEFDGE